MRIQVTLGFQKAVCRECRGLPPACAPVAAIRGRTSKIKRFYWREIQFRKFELLAEVGASSSKPLGVDQSELRREIEARALADIKHLHETRPKYSFSTETEAAFLSRSRINVESLSAPVRKGGQVVREDGTVCAPETFAEEWLGAQGYATMRCESRPFHAIFAVMLWTLLQDPADPLVRTVAFRTRPTSENDESIPGWSWIDLPEDFGSSGYFKRRASGIDEFVSRFLRGTTPDLLFNFDIGVAGSYSLRQYLWAHRDEDLRRARQIVATLPPELTRQVLLHLLEDYWRHYLGWPDIFAWAPGELLLVEVKLSNDKLSDEQRRWIEWNVAARAFPFKLIKIHRESGVPARGAGQSY